MNDRAWITDKINRPLACMIWLVVALLLLGVMAQDIRFESFTNPAVTYTWWEVLILPYSLRFEKAPSDSGEHISIRRL